MEFNNLYTITNNPVGRFEKVLRSENGYEDYIKMLSDIFAYGSVRNRRILVVRETCFPGLEKRQFVIGAERFREWDTSCCEY